MSNHLYIMFPVSGFPLPVIITLTTDSVTSHFRQLEALYKPFDVP